MRYFYLLFIILFATIVYAQILGVELVYPENGMLNTTSNDIKFSCLVAIGVEDTLSNITLYHDISGNFIAEIVDTSMPYEFTVNDIPNGNYKWNCLATNLSNYREFAPSNYTFTVDYTPPATVFTCCIDNQTWQEDTDLDNAFNLSIYFENPATYSVSGNSNINIGIIDGSVSFIPSANWSGIETVTFSSNGVNSNPVTLNVTNINDPPYIIEDIPTQTITKNVDKTIGLGSYISDVDSTLTYTYTSLQHITVSIDGNSVTFSPETDWIGTEYIVFTASDNEYNVSSNNVTLNVVNASTVNHQPQILSFYPLSIPTDIVVGSSYNFSVTFYDEDNDPLTVSWYLNSVLVSSESSYEFLPEEAGEYNLTVYVSDGSLSNSVTWIYDVGGAEGLITGGTASLCGNNQVDAGENCLNCPLDVKCKEDEVCEAGECILIKEAGFGTILIYIVSAIGFLIFSFALISFLEKRRKTKIDKDIIEKARRYIVSGEDEVVNYVRKNLKNKVPESIIKEKLLSVGWPLEQINKSFEQVKNEGKPKTD